MARLHSLLTASLMSATPLAAVAAVAAAAEAPVQLDQLVVTASGFQQSVHQAPASISVIGGEELLEKRVLSLAEALADIEGVDVGASAGKTGGLNVSLRGMPSDYTLILVDGRRQNAAGNITPNGFGETSTSFLPPPAAIERIEVIRGPMSTLYGSDAMGGVVNVITRRVSPNWGGSLALGGTRQEDRAFGDSGQASLHLSGPLVPSRLGLTLRGSHFTRAASDLTYTDAQGRPVEVSKRGPSPVAADISTAGARLDVSLHRDHDLWFDADLYRQTYDNTGGQLGTLDQPGAGTFNGYAPELRFNRTQYTLAHTMRLSRGQLESSLLHNATETIGRTIPPGTPGRAPGGARTLENENRIVDTKLILTVSAHTLSIGGQAWAAEMVDGVAPAPYTHEHWALFAEDEWRLQGNLRLTAGARQDRHSQFGGKVSPRAYLVWNPAPAWTLKGGVSHGFKAPRLDQLADGITGFTGQGTRPTIGTPSLRPETSVSIEAGLAYDNRRGFRAAVTAFRNEFKDKIANGPGLLNATFAGSPNRPGSVNYGNWPAVDTFAQLVNVDRAQTRGLETSLSLRFLEHGSVTATHTYTESEQKSGLELGRPLYDTPRHMANLRVRWRASARLGLWVGGEYRGRRHRAPDSATTNAKALYGDYLAHRLLHTGGSYQLSRYVTFHATISNLLDHDFVAFRPYLTNTRTGTVGYTSLYSNPLEPRRLWLSATYTF